MSDLFDMAGLSLPEIIKVKKEPEAEAAKDTKAEEKTVKDKK